MWPQHSRLTAPQKDLQMEHQSTQPWFVVFRLIQSVADTVINGFGIIGIASLQTTLSVLRNDKKLNPILRQFYIDLIEAYVKAAYAVNTLDRMN